MANRIDVIGLGAGDLDQLPLGIYKRLKETEQTVYVRTLDHPVMAALQKEGVSFSSYDRFYEQEQSFGEVYKRIADDLLEKAKEADVLYAVPGHPMLAEMSVQLLLEQGEIDVNIIGGQSYLDDLFVSLKIDPIEGFQFVDATGFSRDQLNYRNHLVFCQVYDQMSASEVKLVLLEDLPADYPVTIVEAAGTSQEQKRSIPLEELDRSAQISNLTTVYVPPVPEDLLNHTFSRFREVIRILRGPNGCPWDQEQTHESLRRYLIEEVYEVIDAIDEEDDEGIVEELGDVLLQVMMHCQIGEDDGYFTVDDVIRGVTEKMIHRHPHVFGDVKVASTEDVNSNWEKLKREEKQERTSILDGIPKSLPALMRSYKIQKKARKAGFEWEHVEEIWDKFKEEIEEFKQAAAAGNAEEMEKELGDVFFVLVNLAIQYGINPEFALTRTNNKFISRFQYIEQQLQKEGKELEEASLAEMDAYWNEAKGKERL